MRTLHSICGLPTEPIRCQASAGSTRKAVGPVSVMPMPLQTRTPSAAIALDQCVGQRSAAAAPVADMAERRRRRSGDDRAGPGRPRGLAKKVSSRRASNRATKASASKPSRTMTRPPANRVGRLCRLIPAVWKSGRKLAVESAGAKIDRGADVDVIGERHPEGVDHSLGAAGGSRSVEQVPDAVGWPVRDRRPVRRPRPGPHNPRPARHSAARAPSPPPRSYLLRRGTAGTARNPQVSVSSSAGGIRQLSGTRMAPSLAQPNRISKKAMRLRHRMATRSPSPTPRDASNAATAGGALVEGSEAQGPPCRLVLERDPVRRQRRAPGAQIGQAIDHPRFLRPSETRSMAMSATSAGDRSSSQIP